MPRTLLVVGLAAALLVAGAVADRGPGLAFREPAPADLREVVRAAWADTVAAFPARRSCIGDVVVRGDWRLDDHARYLPDEATVVVRIPATAGQLRNALAHEFGHHVEFACPSHADLRPAFLAAQGAAPSTPWFDGATWETTPSEQYAEAVVAYVTGRRLRHTQVPVTRDAVRVVAAWAHGR